VKNLTLANARFRLGSKLDLLAAGNTPGPSSGSPLVWTPSANDNPSLQEVNYYLNAGFDWLYSELAQADPLRYGVVWYFQITPQSLNPSNSTALGLPLPPDFAEALRVDYMIGAGNNGAPSPGNPNPIWMPVKRTSLQEEASYQWNVFTTAAGPSYRYIIENQSIRILPSSQVAGQFRMHYLPARKDLVADSETFDGVLGWEEAVILWAAIQIKAKLDQDASQFIMLLAQYNEKINAMKADRDSADPAGTIDLDAGAFPVFGFPRSMG